MSRIAHALHRLRSEQGVAAIVSIGVIAGLGLASASAVAYTTTNSGSASRSLSDQIAFALAEAALNNAAAVVSNPDNDPTNRDLLPGDSQLYEQGTATWSGTLNEERTVWTIVGVGETRNPTGVSARPVRRRLTMRLPVAAATPATQPLANPLWNWVVATRTGNTCDMTLSSDVSLETRLLVNGNLCLSSGARFTGGSLVVGQRLTLNATDNYVGTAAARIPDVHVGLGCKYGRNHAHPDLSHPTHLFCSSADNVHATVLDQLLPTVVVPTAAYDAWYALAAPGPRNACASPSGPVPTFDNNAVRDKSVTPTVNLTPATSYSCRSGAGELSWNASSRVLTVRGTVYVDGSAKVDNLAMNTYDGQGTIYLTGSFILGGSTKLCAVASGTAECDTAGWNPNAEMLGIVAEGNGDGGAFSGNSIDLGSYSRFQGALYATNNIQFGSYSKTHGPMMGKTIITCAGLQLIPFPHVETVPSGLPGQPVRGSRPGQPIEFSG